ncbi:MAG: hypothetical protein ABI164_04775 [Acidobacteriaceae bacterium]
MVSTQNVLRPGSARTMEPKETTIFGVPIGRMGLLSRVAMSVACGLFLFFVTFVLAIIGVSIYDSVNGISLTNLNITYLYIAAPVGVVALLVALTYLVSGWAKRKFSGVE